MLVTLIALYVLNYNAINIGHSTKYEHDLTLGCIRLQSLGVTKHTVKAQLCTKSWTPTGNKISVGLRNRCTPMWNVYELVVAVLFYQ